MRRDGTQDTSEEDLDDPALGGSPPEAAEDAAAAAADPSLDIDEAPTAVGGAEEADDLLPSDDLVLSDDLVASDEPASDEPASDEPASDEPVPVADVARDGSPEGGDGPARAQGWRGIIPEGFTVGIPGPRRPDRDAVRRALRFTGRLLTLSPRTPTMPAWVAVLVAVGWTVGVGLLMATVLTVVAGAAEPDARLSTLVWLVAHHAPLATDVGNVSLLPLGLLVITVLPLRRAGRFLGAQTQRPDRLRSVAVGAVVAYSGTAGVLALLSGTTLPAAPVLPAALWSAVIAVGAGWWGVVRQRRGRLPVPTFAVAVGVAVAVPLAAGATLTVVTLLLDVGDIVGRQSELATSALDQWGLTLLQVGYLPNLVVWGAAFVIGSGFTLGADHRLSPFASGDAVLPDLPILASVPTQTPSWSAALPILVALGGVLGALAFARRVPEHRLRRRISRALILAVASGATWWVLSLLAGGSLGGGRLESVGPAAGTVLLATVLTGAGTLLWALLPTLASDARPVAIDLRQRVSSAAVAAKEATESRIPSGRKG